MVKIPLPAGSYPIDEHEIINFRHWPERKINRYGLHFDGVDDYVQTSPIAMDAFTIIILYKQEEPGDPVNADTLGTETYIGGNQGFTLRTAGGYFLVNDGTNLYSVELGTRHLYSTLLSTAVTFDKANGIMKSYKNGAYYASEDITGISSIDNGRNITIGKAPNSGSDRFFKGENYFIAFYNRALSDAEISQMYDYAMNGEGYLILDGSVLLLDFTEHGSNILYDKSGNENHGTIYGATWLDEPTGKVDAFVPVVEG